MKDYYKAYDERYKQVYKEDTLWEIDKPTLEVEKYICRYEIDKDSKILEVGCGEGRDTKYLLDQGYNVIGIDCSKTVIDKCIDRTKYKDNFKVFDIFQDKTSLQFDFIYSVAVIHMFLLEEHRDKFYRFIYEHLKDKGKALVISMGDGESEYASNIDEASMIVQRKNINTGKMIQVVNTSCRIKKYSEMEEEIVRNGFRIVEGFIVSDVPGFDKCMSFLIEKV